MEKIALVTGAGQGIGEAIARALGSQRMAVAVAARTSSDIERVAHAIRTDGGNAMPVVCDVTDPFAVARAVRQIERDLGPISILVNNAGASGSSKFLDHDDSLWHQMINTNLDSVYYVTKAVVPGMIRNRWGRIVNIASIAAKVGAKYIAAYTASKHGVLGLTRALAIELAEYNITVNAICPGYVETPMTGRSISNIASRTRISEADARAALENTSPQRRLIAPTEVAAVVVMLVEDSARGISGQAINIDGGAVQY